MKNYSIRLASLALFFATGAAIGMENQPKVIIQNEAWGYDLLNGWGYYDIKVAINDEQFNEDESQQVKGGKAELLGNLNNISQIKIRRSGKLTKVVSWFSGLIAPELPVSVIDPEALNEIKTEANDPINVGKDVILVIGATTTGYALYSHMLRSTTEIKGETIIIDKDNPWSLFPLAEKAKQALQVSNFSASLKDLDALQQKNLITVAKLVLGFNADDKPTQACKKELYRFIFTISSGQNKRTTRSLEISVL